MHKNIFYLADLNGTGFWRRILPIITANPLTNTTQIYNTFTMIPVYDPNYYVGVDSVTIQRWIFDDHRNMLEKFLLPVTRKTGTKLIYEIDDSMGDVPPYNKGGVFFKDEKIQDNIRYMLNACDLVTVTTSYIKDYYNRRYGVPLEKIVAVPNLLSRMWFGDRYDLPRKVD